MSAIHEVELVRRVWHRLREGYDYDTLEPNYRAPSRESVERVVHATLRFLEIPIQPDGSVVTAAPNSPIAPTPNIADRISHVCHVHNAHPDLERDLLALLGEAPERAPAPDTELVKLAREIGKHWREQEGVNAALLERLAEVTS